MSLVQEIVANDMCTGCGACAVISGDADTIELSEPGYMRPRRDIKLSRDELNLVAKVCPGRTLQSPSPKPQKEPLFGGYHLVCEGWATNPDIRYKGASGGALTALLISLLKSSEISGVVVSHASVENPERTLAHIARTEAELVESAGSRYAPVAPVAQLATLLNSTDERLAFVGKPCDVAAVYAWRKFDAVLAAKVPVLISFFCAGVPSQLTTNALLKKVGFSDRTITDFRYRGHGWPGNLFVRDDTGETRELSYEESWGQHLSKSLQTRCKLCPDGTGMLADVVFADPWEVDQKGYPVFEDNPGRSLVLARTQKGAKWVRRAAMSSHLRLHDFDIKRLKYIQPGQVKRRRSVLFRNLGRRLAGASALRVRGYDLIRCGASNTMVDNLKNMAGTWKRTISCKLKQRLQRG